jgi:basic amino acid/polyamine antiporter, APA family
MNKHAAAPATGPALARVLGPWMATALVIGTVIGSGVFKKPQAVAVQVPEFGLAMLAWVLVGLLALIGALALAEVAVLLPRAGGNYVFLREGYGRWAGFLWGWVEFWIIRSASIAALATIFTESLHDILRQVRAAEAGMDVLHYWERHGVTVAVIAVLGWINLRGTRLGGALQVVVTSVKALSLLALAVLPFVILGLVNEPRLRPGLDNLTPLWPADWGAVNWSNFGSALVSVLWAYHGWMNIAPVAEEVRQPSRNLPLALIGGTLTVIALYLTVNFAYGLVIPHDDMVGLRDRTVAGEFCVRLLGPVGLVLASAAVMLSVFGSLNGNLLVGPRLLYAMAHDELAPRALGKLHPRYRTPALAEMVLAGWSILLVVGSAALVEYPLPLLALGSWTLDLNLPRGVMPFDVLTDYAMFGAVWFETLAVASIFPLRWRFPPARVALPYRCWGYPWLPALYVIVMAAVLGNMFVTKRTESLFGLGFVALGAAVYACKFGRRVPRTPVHAALPSVELAAPPAGRE